jgi:hypothetical protein
VGKTHVSVQRKPAALETRQLTQCFPMRTDFERNTYCKSEYSRYRKDHFVANRPILQS